MPRHANSFHVLRLFAATLVIYAHAYPLSGRPPDPIAHWTGGATSGSIGVFIFFTISGWLVSQSFHSDPRLGPFIARRMLRIYPALAVAILGTVFVLGPAVSALAPGEYLSHPATYRYLLGLLVFPVQRTLPGVFAANPFEALVNGSLWTLGPELLCYATVAALGVLALLDRLALGLALAAVLVAHHMMVKSAPAQAFVLFMDATLLLELMVFFLSGALLWTLRGRIVFHWAAVPVLVAAVWAFGRHGHGQVVLFALLPYATLSVALLDSGTSAFFERIGDWSYGTYLWAFPIQQALIGRDPGMPLAAYIVSAVALSWLAGAASWHLVEKRALAFKPAAPSRNCAAPPPAR